MSDIQEEQKRLYKRAEENDIKLLKEEIKEILDRLYNIYPPVSVILKEYITNLEEENTKLKELCDKYEEEHNNEFQCWKRDRKELLDKRGRIEKAIEYINEAIEDTDIAEVINTDELLNILKGVDKE